MGLAFYTSQHPGARASHPPPGSFSAQGILCCSVPAWVGAHTPAMPRVAPTPVISQGWQQGHVLACVSDSCERCLPCPCALALRMLAAWWPWGSHLSICSQFNAFQFKDHLGRNRHAARRMPLLLTVHPEIPAMHRRTGWPFCPLLALLSSSSTVPIFLH